MTDKEDGGYLDLEMMTHFADRKDKLGKLQLNCPACCSPQVQLVAYNKEPAEWKCRICKCKFTYEPTVAK